MGKKLSLTEKSKSTQSVNDFLKNSDYEHVFKTKVYVKDKKGSTIRKVTGVNISINPNFDWINVSVHWEDAGFEDFSSFGLFGVYSTTFVKMRYENDQLVIKSSDSDKVVYINILE